MHWYEHWYYKPDRSSIDPLGTNIPPIHILPKTATKLTSLVLGFEYHSAYHCGTFRVAFTLGINLAMIMCFEL
jgi:hypothetical protein